MKQWTDKTDRTQIELKETNTGFNYISLRNYLHSIGEPVIFTRGQSEITPYVAEYREDYVSLTGFDKSSFILRDNHVNRWMVLNNKWLVIEFEKEYLPYTIIPHSIILTPYAPTTLS